MHANQLQQFLQPIISPEQITDTLTTKGYQHVEDDGDHFWILNNERRVFEGRTYPMLILIYQEGSNTLLYASSDSSLVDYLINDLSQFGYRKTSSGSWRNSSFDISRDYIQLDIDEDDQTDDFWLLRIYDFKAAEERRRMYQSLLVSFGKSADSLEREVYLVNDTARVYALRVSTSITALNSLIQLGDDYHNQGNYEKARQQYQKALKQQTELAEGDMHEAFLYLNRHYNNLSGAITSITERYKPLTWADLEKDYTLLQHTLDTLDYYLTIFNVDNFTSNINGKIKTNDCDDIYQNYRQLYTDKGEVERLYDQKGYERLKKDSEANMRSYRDNRSKLYNQNADLLSYLNISKSRFESLYDQIGEKNMSNRIANARDSILLVALRQSSDLEKANLIKKPVVKIDKRYRSVLKQSEVNFDQYKGRSIYSQMVDIALVRNDKARKEYASNGRYFSGKTAFFNSYISGSYASQLQSLKRQEKARREAEARAREQARRQAEEREKARQQQIRREQIERRRNYHRTSYPAIHYFAAEITGAGGVAYSAYYGLAFNADVGLNLMFPTRRPVSWGIGANYGWRFPLGTNYLTGGLQFYHGYSNRAQFVWALYGGMELGVGPMGTLRYGVRARFFVFYNELDVSPLSNFPFTYKMGFGINIGR